jgi:hypothetical protein
MKLSDDTFDAKAMPPNLVDDSGDRATGLPWLDTWRDVYIFVLACFVIWVGLLVALTVIFS